MSVRVRRSHSDPVDEDKLGSAQDADHTQEELQDANHAQEENETQEIQEIEIPPWEQTAKDPKRVRFDNRQLIIEPIKDCRTVRLEKEGTSFGMSFIGPNRAHHPDSAVEGIYISKLVPGGAADKSNQLFVGDRILLINAIDVRKSDHLEALVVFRTVGNSVVLDVIKDPEGYAAIIMKQQELDNTSGAHHPTAHTPPGANDETDDDTTDESTDNVEYFEALLDERSSVCLTKEDFLEQAQTAYYCLIRQQYREAEEHLLVALGTVIDQRIEKQLKEALAYTNPRQAQLECDMVMYETEIGKGGLYYMLGVAVYHQQRYQQAAAAFRIAVLSVLPWCFFPGMPISANDIEFHRTIGGTLFAQSKFLASHVASREILRQTSLTQPWEQKVDRMFAHLTRTLLTES